jgi:TRAP-type C4-dicarboxylate transport system permease large subunit
LVGAPRGGQASQPGLPADRHHIAGLYSGIFTVNEAASLAAIVSLGFAAARESLSLANLYQALCETAVVVGMLYFILIGSAVFAILSVSPTFPSVWSS